MHPVQALSEVCKYLQPNALPLIEVAPGPPIAEVIQAWPRNHVPVLMAEPRLMPTNTPLNCCGVVAAAPQHRGNWRIPQPTC